MKSQSAVWLLVGLLALAQARDLHRDNEHTKETKHSVQEFRFPPVMDLSELTYRDGNREVPDDPGMDDWSHHTPVLPADPGLDELNMDGPTDLERDDPIQISNVDMEAEPSLPTYAPGATVGTGNVEDGSVSSFQSAIDEINGKNPVPSAAADFHEQKAAPTAARPFQMPMGMNVIPGTVNNMLSVNDIASVTSSDQPMVGTDTAEFQKALDDISGGKMKRFRGSAAEQASYMPGQLLYGKARVMTKNLPGYVHLVPGRGTTVVAADDISDVAEPVEADAEYSDPNQPTDNNSMMSDGFGNNDSNLGEPTVVQEQSPQLPQYNYAAIQGGPVTPQAVPAAAVAPAAAPTVVYVKPTPAEIAQAIIEAQVSAPAGSPLALSAPSPQLVEKAMSMLSQKMMPHAAPTPIAAPKVVPAVVRVAAAPRAQPAAAAVPLKGAARPQAKPAVVPAAKAAVTHTPVVRRPAPASRPVVEMQERPVHSAPAKPATKPDPRVSKPIVVRNTASKATAVSHAKVNSAAQKIPVASVIRAVSTPVPARVVPDGPKVIDGSAAISNMEELGEKVEAEANAQLGITDSEQASMEPTSINTDSAVAAMTALGEKMEHEADPNYSYKANAQAKSVVVTSDSAVNSMEALGEQLEAQANVQQTGQPGSAVGGEPSFLDANSYENKIGTSSPMMSMLETDTDHGPKSRPSSDKGFIISTEHASAEPTMHFMDLQEKTWPTHHSTVIDGSNAPAVAQARGERMMARLSQMEMDESIKAVGGDDDDLVSNYDTSKAVKDLEKRGLALMLKASATNKADLINAVKYDKIAPVPVVQSGSDYDASVENAAQDQDIEDVVRAQATSGPSLKRAGKPTKASKKVTTKPKKASIGDDDSTMALAEVVGDEVQPAGDAATDNRPSSGLAPSSVAQLQEVLNEIASPAGGEENGVAELASNLGGVADELLDDFNTQDEFMSTYEAEVVRLQAGIDKERALAEQHHKQVKDLVMKMIPIVEKARTAQKEAEKNPETAGRMLITKLPALVESFTALKELNTKMKLDRERSDVDKSLEARSVELHNDSAATKANIALKTKEMQAKLALVKGYAEKLEAIALGVKNISKLSAENIKKLTAKAATVVSSATSVASPAAAPAKGN